MIRPAALALSLVVAFSASAQHHGAHHPPAAAGTSTAQPYATMASRRVKALSATQEDDLRAGRGMALALAAELNGYPGPMHVLEHGDALGLTAEQRATATRLRATMSADAQSLGLRILSLEQELDALFASGTAEPGRLAGLTTQLGGLGGRLREVHLTAHIAMRSALDAQQRSHYARLRGYPALP